MPDRAQAGRVFNDAAAPLFTVGQVADIMGVQQAFLRRLDAQDLVCPARSDGRQRRYSRNDIDRLQTVMTLIDDGLTLAGVRRVLELQAEVTALKRELARERARDR